MSTPVFLTGLPRSGSTLLANILAMHPDITATPSSPLCHIVQIMKRQWSDDSFLLAQLDSNFDEVYQRVERSTKAFINEWSESGSKITVDKNRGWLSSCELLRDLYPDVKIIITIRDLRAIFSSIEKQHRKTLLLDFPDHMDANIADTRAESLFTKGGVIGGPLNAINNIADVPNILPHLYYFRFEDIGPKSVNHLFEWLGLDKYDIDWDDITQSTNESDSHYRFKYLHSIRKKFSPPEIDFEKTVSPRINSAIVEKNLWFYRQHYPDLIRNDVNPFPQFPIDKPAPPEEQPMPADQYDKSQLDAAIDKEDE